MEDKSTPEVYPELKLLAEEQIKRVHKLSTEILETTGIKVESNSAIQIFKDSGAVRIENDIVFIGKELIEHAIRVAPSNIEIYNRSGNFALNLGRKQKRETHFGIGVTNTFFQEIESNALVPFTREHMRCSAAFGDSLENYSMISTIGIPSDAPTENLDLYSTLDLYGNASKPLVLLFSENQSIAEVFKLLNFLHGDISHKPFCMPYVNPITPLVMNASTTDKMISTIKHGLPIIYSNYSMYGGTSPYQESGSMVLLNAELLAGLVFGQLVKEGAEMILGSLPAAFNMQTMGSYYTPSAYLLNLACSEMMKHYNIPHCGTSGSGNGWGGDISASGDLWLNHLTSCIGKVGCAPFVGGNFDSLAFSPTTVVLADRIIGEAKKFAAGFQFQNDSNILSEIKEAGHGGDYFTSPGTLESMAEFQESNEIWPMLNIDGWKEMGEPKAAKYLIEVAQDLYSRVEKKTQENMEIIRKGESFIKDLS